MRVGEFYSVVAMVFAKNFIATPDITDVMNVRKSKGWILQTKSENFALGSATYEKFLAGESIAIIGDDFIALQKFFDAEYYIQGAGDDLAEFYKMCGFTPRAGKISSVSNQLVLVGAILKNELNEQSNAFLVRFLTGYFLPYVTILSSDLIANAQSNFYKSMGYFLADYCAVLQETFSIKQKI